MCGRTREVHPFRSLTPLRKREQRSLREPEIPKFKASKLSIISELSSSEIICFNSVNVFTSLIKSSNAILYERKFFRNFYFIRSEGKVNINAIPKIRFKLFDFIYLLPLHDKEIRII